MILVPGYENGQQKMKEKNTQNSRYFQIEAIQMVDISKTLSGHYKEALLPVLIQQSCLSRKKMGIQACCSTASKH